MNEINFAEYSGPEFVSDRAGFPYAQVNNLSDPALNGVLILNEQIEKAKFSPRGSKAWKPVRSKFHNGNPMEGMIAQNIVVCILGVTPVYLFQRGTDDYLGQCKPDIYNSDEHYTKQRYLVFFMGPDGPLSEKPFQLTASGVFGGSFGAAVKNFRADIDALAKRTMTHKFHCLWQLFVTTKAEMRGKRQSSWCCVADRALNLTPQNYLRSYLGGNKPVADKLLAAFDEHHETFIKAPIVNVQEDDNPEIARSQSRPIQNVSQPHTSETVPVRPVSQPLPVAQQNLYEDIPF